MGERLLGLGFGLVGAYWRTLSLYHRRRSLTEVRRNTRKAYIATGIEYAPESGRWPLLLGHPPDLLLTAKFPDNDILRIHLTFERGYQDIDGMAHLSLYEAFAQRLLTIGDLSLDGDATVLDCACGSGYGSAFLRQVLKCRVQGVDVDHSTIAYAQKRYSQSHPHLTFSQGDATDLGPIESDSVRAIVSIETIEHVSGDVAAIVEFHRVLAPGGILFITTPDSTERPGTMISDFHTREDTYAEFHALLFNHFSEVEIASANQYLIAVCRK